MRKKTAPSRPPSVEKIAPKNSHSTRLPIIRATCMAKVVLTSPYAYRSIHSLRSGGMFPEFSSTPRGTARIAGQVAFAHAALGHRSEARTWALGAIRNDRRQLRAYAALAIAARLAPAPLLVDLVNRRGRGL